jgi:diguanylate cyclase (GGDEF)-like protein
MLILISLYETHKPWFNIKLRFGIRAMFRLSARSVLVAGVAILLTASVWLVVGYTIRETQQAALEAARVRAKATSILFAEQVTSTFGNIDSLLRVTGRDLVERPGITLKSLIATNPSAQPNLVLMTWVDANGVAHETANGPITPVSLIDREHIRVHLEAPADIGLYIGKPVLGRVSGRWTIQITRTVRDNTGSLRGILVYSLDPQYFERFYAKLELEELDDIALIGRDGVVRMQARDTLEALAATARRDDLILRERAEGSFSFSEVVKGTRYESYVQGVKDYPVFVSARVSDRRIKDVVRRQTFENASFGAVITMLIVGLMLFIMRWSSALERLVQSRTAELQDAVDKLGQISHTDALTQIPNRRAFDAALRRAHQAFVDDKTPYGLVLVDIDHFKQVNDVCGHDVGDLVLCGVAARLREECRKEDFVARVGGEEFAMILHGKQPGEGAVIARRLCEHIAEQSIMGQVVTISSGVAPGSPDGCDATYRHADEALYRAKESGRNRSVMV